MSNTIRLLKIQVASFSFSYINGFIKYLQVISFITQLISYKNAMRKQVTQHRYVILFMYLYYFSAEAINPILMWWK